MARQSLIWTTLPTGLDEDGSLKVSVLLSPRLDAETDPPRLDSFHPDWADWPATLAGATFRIHYGSDSVAVPASQTDGASRVDTALGALDSAAWGALFAPDLLVRSFVFKDLTTDRVVSYDTTAIDALVRDLYTDLASRAGGELPRVSDLLDDPAWQQVVSVVAGIDRLVMDDKTGLRDPDRQFQLFAGDEDVLGIGTTAVQLGRLHTFHTPPAKPKPTVHKRDDDGRIEARWLEFEPTELKKEDAGKGIDFHQVVAALNQYPTLLRHLGLVVDFIVPAQKFTGSLDAPLWTEVDFPAGALAIPTIPDVSPVTHAALSGDHFRAVSNPLPAVEELRVSDGLLELDPKRFALLQSDVDAAGLKLMGFARSLARLVPAEQRVDAVDRFEKEIGAPSLRTAGLMLVHRRRGKALKKRFEASKKKETAAASASAPELWAEDLVRGFRFDVWDRQTAVWRSLCERLATYDLGSGKRVIGPELEEEGTVRLAATRALDPTSNPDLLYLHEAVVSWAGWGLAAPPPGRAILKDDKVDKTTTRTEAEVPPGIRLKTTFRALPGSLPRLRFGRRYWIRGRVVDLAGNSLAPRRTDFGPEQPATNASRFLRWEPIASPVIALVKGEDGTTEAPAEGESMARVAIRSFNDTPADNQVPTGQEARRYAVPPQASVRDAELHGMLDAGGKVDSSNFNLLAHAKDKDASMPDAAPREEKLPMQGPLDLAPVDTTFAVYPDGHELTYLPDPLAEKVAVRVFRHPNIADSKVLTIPLYPEGAWPEAQPFKIRVFEDAAAAPWWDEAAGTLQVPLPKAIRAEVRLSIKTSSDVRDKLGVWNWLPVADQAALADLAADGQHWMLTPWRTVEAVHAVQRPLIAPAVSKHILERHDGATFAVPRLTASCSLKSTDKVDLVAEWHEPDDEPAVAANEEVASHLSRGDTAFTVKITTPENYATQLDGHARGGFPDHLILAEDVIGIGMPQHAFGDLLPPKRHEFNDTRYRRIQYRLVATSSFREFLPAALLTVPETDPVETTDKHIKVEGPRLVTWIPSSAPPPAPEVVYVVPTFGWVRTPRDEAGTDRSWRRGGGLRVYLDRPWMVSGYGEMLAVVLPPASFTGDPEGEPEGDPYKKYVTQWGNDPIWRSAFVSGVAPAAGDFPRARTESDPTGSWLPEDAPEDESDQPPEPFLVAGLRPPAASPATIVEIAPHDVYYDRTRRLWYCDIEIDQGASYFPFIRLALARYQPVATSRAHLSNVVLADFMPLAADRWLNVHRSKDPRELRVNVFGHRFSDSSGHQEAESASSMSVLVDPINNVWKTLEPAEVAKTTVVEVWVERLDPSQGEDFGWRRVTDAVVEPAGATPEVSVSPATPSPATPSRFIPAHEIKRAHRLARERRFDALLQEDLVDKLYYFTSLWSGKVTLPTVPADGDRHRLVIAEYEEYLVDDDRPYDAVPTRKDRRLVFVEHVDLVP